MSIGQLSDFRRGFAHKPKRKFISLGPAIAEFRMAGATSRTWNKSDHILCGVTGSTTGSHNRKHTKNHKPQDS